MATKQINEFTAVGSSALTDQLLTETAANATRKCTLSQVFALLDDQAITWTAAQAFGAAVTMATTLGVTGAATFGSTVGVTGTLTAGNLATGGTLAATGAATLGSTLAVTGAATLSSTLAAGASTLASLAVTAGATIGTTLGVTGAATLSSTLAVTGVSTLTGGMVAVAAPATFTSNVVGARKERTDTSGNRATAVFEAVADPSGASTALVSGVIGYAETKAGNAQSLPSLGLSGVRGVVVNAGSGAVNSAANFYAPAIANTGGGTIANAIGLYLAAQTVGTNNYGVYQVGTTERNFFGSNAISAGGGHQFGATAQVSTTNTLVGARVSSTATTGFDSTLAAQMSPAPASASTAAYTAMAGYCYAANVYTAGAALYGAHLDVRSDYDTGTLIGVYGRSRPGHASGQTIASGHGMRASYEPSSTGLTTNGYGIRSDVAPTGTGTITTAYGLFSNVAPTAASTLTTAYGLYAAASNSGGATIGTYMGVRVAASASYATTTWGVYVDAAKSNFGGGLIAGAPVQHASYTVGTLPAAATWPRGEAYCSDETGGATLVFSDGTNWRRHGDRAIAA